jgi:hypothetical protein
LIHLITKKNKKGTIKLAVNILGVASTHTSSTMITAEIGFSTTKTSQPGSSSAGAKDYYY